ncbi:MAG: hypothetical protein Q4B36_08765 [Tissierellia bacterium]|nr:hypothetical protein [Tissierellia bacterium]
MKVKALILVLILVVLSNKAEASSIESNENIEIKEDNHIEVTIDDISMIPKDAILTENNVIKEYNLNTNSIDSKHNDTQNLLERIQIDTKKHKKHKKTSPQDDNLILDSVEKRGKLLEFMKDFQK